MDGQILAQIKQSFFILLAGLVLLACNPPERSNELLQHRQERNEYMLSSDSPLPENERGHFVGLNFFPPNAELMVPARFSALLAGEVIEFRTNTDRTPRYQKFARLDFMIGDTACTLFAYQSLDHQEDGLFVPFNDATNGRSSYATGRYLDIAIPEGDSLLLDFNYCYNPYCSYSDRYSCPIPPIENALPVTLCAGEMNYH